MSVPRRRWQNPDQGAESEREAFALVLEHGDEECMIARIREKAFDRTFITQSYDIGTPRESWTPIAHAAHRGYKEAVQLLLELRVDVNEKSGYGTQSGTPLYYAARRGHTAIAELLLAHGAYPNGTHSFCDPLSEAADQGHGAVARLLIENGAAVNPKGDNSLTPLFYAAYSGHENIVRLLIEKGAEVNLKNSEGWTPLSLAAKYGHDPVVRLLIKEGDEVDFKDSEGWTPLSLAAKDGHEPVVRLLIEEGAEVNSKDNCGRTPLSYTADVGHESIIRLLIKSRADVNSKDNSGRIPLSYAANNGLRKTVGLLIENGAEVDSEDDHGRTPLSYAADDGHENVVKLLLAQSVKLDSKDNDGRTPLSYAASSGEKAVVEKLLAQSADPDSEDSNGNTPISYAVAGEEKAIVKLLLQNPCDLASKESRIKTWLGKAVESGRVWLLELLLFDHDHVSVNFKDTNGRTLLSYAAKNRDAAVVRLLLMNRADPDLKCTGEEGSGRTPLLYAACNGHDEIVKLLLEEMANPDSGDTLGRTPLSYAACNGHHEIVELLLNKEANPDSRDDHSQTPLWWAAENEHRKVMALLIPKDRITLHMLIKHRQRKLVQFLVETGYDVNASNSSGTTPLRLAMHQKDLDLVDVLLKQSACTKGITVDDWLDAGAGNATTVVRLSKGTDGKTNVRFLNELPQTFDESERCLFVFKDNSHWPKVPIDHSKEQSQPNKLLTSCQPDVDGHRAHLFVSLQSPVQQDLFWGDFNMPDWSNCRIAWTVIRPKNPDGQPWESTDYFSMLPNGWIPKDGVDFLEQFVLQLKEKWLKLCSQAEEHQTKRRAYQLKSEGKTLELMHRLANDAQIWTELRRILQDHIREARTFVADYCQRYDANESPKALQQHLDGFEAEIGNRISGLDQTVRDLLQIEFAWASVTEARISTRLGQNVMFLTYVSIFYLPLAFCAALWAIPDISNSSTRNPFLITSIVVGLVTLLAAFNLENIGGVVGKLYFGWRAKLLSGMRGDNHWKERAEQLQESNLHRSTPSEWWLLGYLIYRIMGMMSWLSKKKADIEDEESKLDVSHKTEQTA